MRMRFLLTNVMFFVVYSVHFLFCEQLEFKEKILKLEESRFISKIQQIESIHVTQVTLSNGMTICLKPTDTETDEIFFKFAALGGFASLPPELFVSGKLADKIAWESGIGEMSSDQFSVFLYENSLEFIPEIFPFRRTIEGESPKKNIEAFLKCVNLLFTQPRFTKTSYDAVKISAAEMIKKISHDNESAYEAFFLGVNTHNYHALKPLSLQDIKKVDFEAAKKFFYECFSNPSDFFCIVTGNFNVDEVINLILKYLGPLPIVKANLGLKKEYFVSFPEGITEKIIYLTNQQNCLTHVTFPLKFFVDESNIHEIAFMCQIIEARLRRIIIDKMNLSYGVDVSYEFPVYPYLNNPWISIRYRCEEKILKNLKEIVMGELHCLIANGVTINEVELIKKLEQSSQSFWLKDDFYWVSMLTNYYLWGWNPEKIDYTNTSIYDLNVSQVNAILKRAISLTNYSIITAVPQKFKYSN